MKKICHILSVPFTGFGAHGGYRGDDWLAARIRIFKNFVVPSLVAQSKREFILWCQFRPQDETNPQILELWKSLDGVRGLAVIFTFYGACLYDDKYPAEVARERLKRSLSFSLKALVPAVAEADWVYLTCQPSDDLYMMSAFEKIQEIEPEEKLAIAWKKGYICNYSTKEIGEYDPDTMPPFATVVFSKETFIDAQKHFDYIGPYESHEFVQDHFKVRWMEGRGFLVGCHGANISTAWSIPYKKRELLGHERETVWLAFGIWDADPVVMHKSFRLYGRLAYNLLPSFIQPAVKQAYHSFRAYVRGF